ncbi:hypothetical protein BC826DRAFT_118310 [Russula brevipes]|nr:hypothetical protein BC826DRAFT_118310 [Russula brevipes]
MSSTIDRVTGTADKKTSRVRPHSCKTKESTDFRNTGVKGQRKMIRVMLFEPIRFKMSLAPCILARTNKVWISPLNSLDDCHLVYSGTGRHVRGQNVDRAPMQRSVQCRIKQDKSRGGRRNECGRFDKEVAGLGHPFTLASLRWHTVENGDVGPPGAQFTIRVRSKGAGGGGDHDNNSMEAVWKPAIGNDMTLP